MAIDTSGPRSRRALLVGAAGGLAALAAHALGRPTPVYAEGEPVVVGGDHTTALTETRLQNFVNSNNVFEGLSEGGGTGVFGSSASGTGVRGTSETGRGVYGTTSGASTVGVEGEVSSAGQTSAIAIRGRTAGHHSQVAVDADALSGVGEGYAVRARIQNGIALYGQASGGYGLQVVGRAVFSRSGKATVPAGQSSKTVSAYAIDAASVVVATVQGGGGVFVKTVSVNATADTFTIRLNKAAPVAGTVVGFFIVN